ncbi:uncharacterized protein LOC103045994 [Astyanax mexicanus]|uniref:uncharacterized protein LOC103045994 n=1 Tax=Astyanax mexicanus TaxID=7994 RepID=UPI0020CACA2F|nr:uncharacterized protein LOC103045994 [Astyanax mexicanus]
MLCYWGEEEGVRAGFGLVKPGRVQRTQSGVSFFSPGGRITQLAAGQRLVGFIRGDGSVSVLRLTPLEAPCESLELKEKIRLMSCGETQAVLLADGGKVLLMDQLNFCRPVAELSGTKVIQVACGNQHCMALTHDGQLFTWGENSSGQLGLGSGKSNSPQPLRSLRGIPLAQISAGGDHSFALSLSGTVFGWGRNNAGQLGLGNAENRSTPACVNHLNLKKTVFISCGEDHTATLSKGGTVFTFGSGRFGQLGHNSFRDELRPRVVAALWGSKVSQITCGRNHTLALVSSSNTVYSFGWQLGNGQQTNQCVPLPVDLLPESNHGQEIEQIAAGGNHSFALCSQQENDSVQPESTQNEGILVLEDRLIDRWISECGTNQWKTIKKEITQVFSSAACLNGSFVKKSCDGHYQTSTNFSGLDLESVRAAFERLAKKDMVLLEVEKIVENKLLPSLGDAAFDVEALRIYLILPELLRVLNKPLREMKLTAELASAILRLKPFMLQVLKNYWSELPVDFLKHLVELFRKPLAHIISQKTYHPQADITDEHLKKFVQVLQLIYKASCSSQREITTEDFFIHDINIIFETMATAFTQMSLNFFQNFEVLINIQYLVVILNYLKSSPCIFNLEAKCNLLKIRPIYSLFRLELRRTALLEDCFRQLKTANEWALKGCLQVVFSEQKEEIKDVHKRDFFINVYQELLMPESGMFMYNDSKTLIWFPSEPSFPEERYFLFGCLCGLAFYNNSVVNLPFPLALFKKLVNVQPSLEDLTEFSPVLGQSLQSILDYSDEDLQSAEMPYTIVWDNQVIDLDPNKPEKVITSSNKKKFVEAYVDHAMNGSVERVFEEFRRGFYKVCDRDVVKLFLPEELRGVMLGSEEYDWDILKQNVTYEGLFHPRHPTIISFWEVFDELSARDKKAFLLFLTGFDRVPVLGMNQVKMRVRPLLFYTQDHLPEALTCHSLLELPVYNTKETLRDKLTEALQHKRGFWDDENTSLYKEQTELLRARAVPSSVPEMLCYWGEEEGVRAGFGLVKPGGVQRTQSGVSFCSPGGRITQLAAGQRLLGLIRGDGSASVLRLTPSGAPCGKPKGLNLNLNDKIQLMSCGETQAVLVVNGGKIIWMNQSNICRPISKLYGRSIIQVACGKQHCMALTHDGQLFTWGENSSGQLGLGRVEPSFPQPLRSLCGIPLAQISAGGDHSFALSMSGAVFGWGRNNSGQLGLGDTEDRYTPASVTHLSLKRTVFISCGEDHTATLSKGGTVFTFGSGCFGQLGHNSFIDELRPRVVTALWGSKVSHITCGRHHTLTLVHSSNTVYSFGRGQMGNGQQTNQCVPLPVDLPPETNHNLTIVQIAAGGNLSFVLCSQQGNNSDYPKPKQERRIVVLEDRQIDRWIRECDTKQWKTIKKEIKRVFSSAACLNGSFIKKSCDGHYQTSTNFSGLDLESVRAAFERLAEKDKVLSEVEKIVENKLLPSLGDAAFDVEALRVYLILPELLRVLNKPLREMKLTAELASAILGLNPFMLQVLKNYCSELTDDFIKTLVELFRNPIAKIISQKTFNPQADITDEHLKKYVQVLQLVYKASSSSQREIITRDFFIYEINTLLDILQVVTATPNWFQNPVYLVNVQYLEQILNVLKSSPCIFNLEAKCTLLKIRPVQCSLRLVLRRTALLEDCFSQLKTANCLVLKGRLQVVYSENLEKTDVNKRDFFHNVFQELLKPESKMFMYNDTKTLIWFPSEPSLPEDRYFLFGCLCGLVFYNNSVVNLPFPLALFKKLLNVQPSLEDLTEFSPVLGKSLQSTLDYSDEVLQSAEMPYTIFWDNKVIDLDPNEPEKVITSSNKKKFVEAYVDHAMNGSVERVFEEFRRGFYKVCDRDVVEVFQPEELRGVMAGSEECDWDILKQNVTYEGLFHPKHPTIISFWEVFDELSDRNKKAFLLFLTGFDRVPVLGMNQVKMRVCPRLPSTQDHLPEALTCHSLLQLPVYNTKETLQAKLTEALQHKRGFWDD